MTTLRSEGSEELRGDREVAAQYHPFSASIIFIDRIFPTAKENADTKPTERKRGGRQCWEAWRMGQVREKERRLGRGEGASAEGTAAAGLRLEGRWCEAEGQGCR